MELPSKISERIAFNTRLKIEEQVLNNLDNSIHEEHLSQPLQTINKHFKIAVTFLTGYNGSFIVTDKTNRFYFAKSITDTDGFVQKATPQGAYELESLNDEIERNIIEGHFTEVDYPFTIKPKFSTLGSVIELSRQEPLNSLPPDDSIRNLLGFNAATLYEEYSLSPNPVDFLKFDNIFQNVILLKVRFLKAKEVE